MERHQRKKSAEECQRLSELLEPTELAISVAETKEKDTRNGLTSPVKSMLAVPYIMIFQCERRQRYSI
ncbi:hypothetical protein Y032_0039g75 [Ancylostoma ceylanicum]|uniref:Uncharacterized protein n=1 Tax=Ancylostoma ceylanicum TaxID=53326 RepID=A0A016UJ24_9BILA|nr:hypothetical protein Y032_0039g75 [Ancylostoma ceylanicum]